MAGKYYAHSLPGRQADSHGQTRENLCSEHREREGVAPAALLLEGATQASVTAWQRLEEHLKNVAEMARGFAEDFGAGEWGYLAGLWHDLGKVNE